METFAQIISRIATDVRNAPTVPRKRKAAAAPVNARANPLNAAPTGEFIAEPASITEAANALRFVLAGNATFTLRSRKTGTRFTYRVRRSDDGRIHFVSVLTGSDNEHSYSYFGYIRHSVAGPTFFYGNAKARITRDAPSCRAFEWTFAHLIRDTIPDSLEIWHEGRCGRCGRKLTVPESIETGFGPECAGKV
jgi:hypothetical protein